MKNITKLIATKGLLIILSLFVILHFLILFGVVPYEMVWGGRLKGTSQMIVFELISILINVAMLAVVAADSGILNLKIDRRIIKGLLWIMFVVFLLNTAGNLLSSNELEKLLFTPLTVLLALFSLRLAIDKMQKKGSYETGHTIN
ncbi:hypothetical protein ACSX1A_12950 [Pontibacter sp. MBLB2868]|uniref:hypothetical protein n=1 Tax=Pontibacter sp. MBLB2868 TaxID=3451555 RepID=UPI003F74AF63